MGKQHLSQSQRQATREALLKKTMEFDSNVQVSNKTFSHAHTVNVRDPFSQKSDSIFLDLCLNFPFTVHHKDSFPVSELS